MTSNLTDAPYEALNPKRKRRSTTWQVKSEDRLLTDRRREALTSNNLDIYRNMGLLAWAIRRTLDYCCLWDFQPRTTDDGLNAALKELMARDMQPERCDVFGRMDWDDMRRTAGAQQILAGDMFFVKTMGKLQAIEGAYCKTPQGRKKDGEKWHNGAKRDRSGRIVAWGFDEDTPTGRDRKPRTIRASNVWQYMQFDGRPNLTRGISPLFAAANEFRDAHEVMEHMRSKVKLDQLFGLAFKRQEEAEGFPASDGAEDDEDTDTPETETRVVDFGDGPAVFDLDEGEDVQSIQSDNPSGNSQDFLKLCLQIALKALDIPYNFFDESHTNFFGSRAAWIQYERAATARRKAQLQLHQRYTRWKLWHWVLPVDAGGTGELILPRSMRVQDLKYKWVPRGIPWWKPAEELDTALRAVAAGLKTMQDVCDEHGLGDYRENLRELQAERAEIEEHGFLLQWSKNAMAVLQPKGAAV